MTPPEAAVPRSKPRTLSHLEIAGRIVKLKSSVYERASVEAYMLKCGYRKAGRYPKEA